MIKLINQLNKNPLNLNSNMKMEINKISFAYGKHQVLKEVSFQIESGDFLCVLGPNGVGKSTLFRCMLGLQNNYQGAITIDGQDISKLSSGKLAQKVAYIPQTSTPAFNYTVFNAVLMGTTASLGSLANPKKEQEDAAIATLERFNILHLKDRNIDEISGGEHQLVLIARAIAQNAKILIMDEPTANLDYGNQIRVMSTIRQLAKEGYSIILSTHNPEHPLLYANLVLVILDGSVLCFGKPSTALNTEVLQKAYNINATLETITIGKYSRKFCVPSEIYTQSI